VQGSLGLSGGGWIRTLEAPNDAYRFQDQSVVSDQIAFILAVSASRPRVVVVALAGAGSPPPQGEGQDTEQASRLVVQERPVNTGQSYIEGALQYLVIKRRDTGETVVRREYRERMWLNKQLPAGDYRLVSYTRSCAGICPAPNPEPCTDTSCPSPGYLDPPTDRCAENFRLRRGRTGRALVRVGVGIRCRVSFANHRIAIRSESPRDRSLAFDLRRYLRRNAGVARWYWAVRTIRARRGVLAVHTALRRTARGRAAADEICNLIQGADVADFTPGHSVRGTANVEIVACPHRTE
jgi:hypothetical protein